MFVISQSIENARGNKMTYEPAKLYFVKAIHNGECVAGGHWLALSSNAAKNLAKDAFAISAATAQAYKMTALPPLSECSFVANVSDAKRENAMNLS